MSSSVKNSTTARKVVGSLGVIGAAAAVAGMGTFGTFTDSSTPVNTTINSATLQLGHPRHQRRPGRRDDPGEHRWLPAR